MIATLRSALTLTALGVAAGLLLTFAASGVTQHYLFEASPLDASSAILAVALLSGTAAFAALVPAYRITARNALNALRGE